MKQVIKLHDREYIQSDPRAYTVIAKRGKIFLGVSMLHRVKFCLARNGDDDTFINPEDHPWIVDMGTLFRKNRGHRITSREFAPGDGQIQAILKEAQNVMEPTPMFEQVSQGLSGLTHYEEQMNEAMVSSPEGAKLKDATDELKELYAQMTAKQKEIKELKEGVSTQMETFVKTEKGQMVEEAKLMNAGAFLATTDKDVAKNHHLLLVPAVKVD